MDAYKPFRFGSLPKFILIPGLALVLLLASTLIVSAMSGGDFNLPWTTFDGGGAAFSTGGDYSLGGTIGQPDAGQHSGGDFALSGGFWVAPPTPVVDDDDDDSSPNRLPATGFPPGRVTMLPAQLREKVYITHTNLWLEIPKLGLALDIYEVPLVDGDWDVTWLGRNAGYLSGTAFPTWVGNTAITAHVWDAQNNPGPFIDLHKLQFGDKVIIHAFGQRHIYEVRTNRLAAPSNLSVLAHSEYDLLTLLTCESWEEGQSYRYRRAVQAVLVAVEPE
jgi:LPXTG-site transpeptidase (sortase) family protein